MYFSLARTTEYTRSVVAELSSLADAERAHLAETTDLFLIPDFIGIGPTAEVLRESPLEVWLGAQDCHSEDAGAFTGEVSPAVLREAGVRIVEVGHAERRRLFGEDDASTARKAAAAARNGLIPLVCIGEVSRTGEGVEAQVGAAIAEVRGQVDAVLAQVDDAAEVVLAYEPVWAIGAAQPADEAHVRGVARGIRGLDSLKSRKGLTRILYGGSAGPGLYDRINDGHVDGLFLGRFGHDPKQFLATVKEVANAERF
jgi:triosephosphate isomerase